MGCSTHPQPGLAHGALHAWNATVAGHVSLDETYLVATTGIVDVDIDSFAGDVVIQSAGKGETAKIDVVRRGSHGFDRRSESKESLDKIDVKYGVEDRAGRKALVIKARTTDVEPWFQRADMTVTVPQLGVVVVRTTNGHVFVTGTEDGVDIETTKGDVRVCTNAILTKPSTILNAEGSIDWRVPPLSTGRVEAEAVNGEVLLRVKDGVWLGLDRRNDDNSLYGVLNKGTNLIALRTVDGDIRIYVGKYPTEMGTFGE